jgi:predicted ABC-type ATPase
MFAGPNGSGKSTLKSYLPLALLGVYLNPDEMELKSDQIPAWFKRAVLDKIT